METKENNSEGIEDSYEPDMNEIPQHLRKYINAKLDYYKLSIIEFISGLGAKAASGLVLVLIGLFFLTFLSIGVALGLNNLTGSTFAGFFIVTAFYLLLFVLLYLIKGKSIERPVMNAIIRLLANWKIEDEDEN